MTIPKFILQKDTEFSDIHWTKENNPSRQGDYGSKAENEATRKALAKAGWNTQFVVRSEKMTAEEIKSAIAEREKTLDVLLTIANSSAGTAEDQLRYKMTKQAWVDKKGKVKPPKFLGTIANRRGSQYIEAMMERDKAGEEVNWEIPVEIPDTKDKAGNPHRYTSPEVRLEVQIDENERKTEGFKPYTDTNRLSMARVFVEKYGKNQSFLRTLFGATIGVKLFFLVLIALWEESKKWGVDFYNRLLMPKDKAGSINIKSISHKACQDFGPRVASDEEFKRKNASLATANKPALERPVKAEFESWLAKATHADQPAPVKIMEKGTIEGLAARCPLDLGKKAFAAVFHDDQSILESLYVRVDGHNVIDRITPDVYELLKPALVKLEKVSIADQQSAIEQFHAVLAKMPALAVETPVAGDDDEEEDDEDLEGTESLEEEEANA